MNGRYALPFRLLHGGALVLLMALAIGCASGPKYGAARKKRKSCDCPHWNRVAEPGPALRAHTSPPAGSPNGTDGARN